ncbi:HAUS augmin-like complex subunit 5 isoform X2 [Heptranchias perlo]
MLSSEQKRKKLMEQVASLRADVQQLDETLDTEQINEQALVETRERLQDLKQQNALLRAFSLRAANHRKVVQEHSKKVGDRLAVFRQISSKAEQEVGISDTKEGSKHKLWHGTGPEPEVLQDVRGACFRRFQFLKSLYDEQDSSTESCGGGGHDLRSAIYQQWLSQVEGANATHPPNHILTALESLAAENEEELVELSSKIDVVKDMASLRFSYTSSHLQDESEPAAVLRSVKSLLEEGWRDCEVRAVEKIGAIRREKEMSSKLSSLVRELNLVLEERYGHSSELLAATREAIELELNVTERRKYHQELKEQGHLLANSLYTKNSEIRALQQKHGRILDFQQLVDRKQDLIRALVKGNSSAKSHLMKTQAEIGSFVEKKLEKHEESIRSLTADLHNSISSEVKLFTTISLPCLDRRVIDEMQRVPVHKLSIYRLDTSFSNPQFFRGIKQSLSFPLYKAPEHLIERAAQVKMEVMALRAKLSHQRNALQALQRQHHITPVTDAQALTERVQELNDECSKSTIPAIQKQLDQCNQAIEFTDELRNEIQDWWEQPAQFLVPWIKQHGMNVQQWVQKWNALIQWDLAQAAERRRLHPANPREPELTVSASREFVRCIAFEVTERSVTVGLVLKLD